MRGTLIENPRFAYVVEALPSRHTCKRPHCLSVLVTCKTPKAGIVVGPDCSNTVRSRSVHRSNTSAAGLTMLRSANGSCDRRSGPQRGTVTLRFGDRQTSRAAPRAMGVGRPNSIKNPMMTAGCYGVQRGRGVVVAQGIMWRGLPPIGWSPDDGQARRN